VFYGNEGARINGNYWWIFFWGFVNLFLNIVVCFLKFKIIQRTNKTNFYYVRSRSNVNLVVVSDQIEIGLCVGESVSARISPLWSNKIDRKSLTISFVKTWV